MKNFSGVLSENPKEPVFLTFFGPKHDFFRFRTTFLIFGTPFTINWTAACKFDLNRSNTAKLQRVSIE